MILRILSVSFWTIPVVVFRFWPRQTNAITFNGEMQLLLHKFFVLAKFDCSFCWLNFPMYACYSVCLLLLGFFFFFCRQSSIQNIKAFGVDFAFLIILIWFPRLGVFFSNRFTHSISIRESMISHIHYFCFFFLVFLFAN